MDKQDQGIFKTELFIKSGSEGYAAFWRVGGGEEVSVALEGAPDLPPPGTISPLEYGTRLFQWVFRGELLRSLRLLQEVSYRAGDELPSMRLLLRLEKDSPLSALPWETMCASPYALPISVTSAFSRFVYGRAPSRPTTWERPIRVLLIISNPKGLQHFDLDMVDSQLEKSIVENAQRVLADKIEVKRLTDPSLLGIRKAQSAENHITHLLAHATVEDGLGRVLLADNDGEAISVHLSEVAAAIASPSEKNAPSLVFLALPVNGEAPRGQVLLELSSLLIDAGVQSVVVVKAPMDPTSLRIFMEKFYQYLLDTGSIDVAVAGARKRIFLERNAESWDWAWPLLFTRSSDSSIQRMPPGLESAVNAIKF